QTCTHRHAHTDTHTHAHARTHARTLTALSWRNCRFTMSVSPHLQLRAGETVPLHHVRAEELPARAVPQLEARGDGGSLHVRPPAESLRNLHARAREHSHS